MMRFKSPRGHLMLSLLILGSTVFASTWVARVHADQTTVASIGLPQTQTCLSNPNYSNGHNLCVGLTATLSKDLAERDSTHDYYGVALRLWNENSTYNGIVSMDAYLTFSTNGGSLFALQPQAGTIGSQQTISLSAGGVSLVIPLYVPDQVVTTDTSTGVLTTTVHWEVRGDTGICCNTIFTNYGELGVIFSVAEDASANVSASAGFFCPDGGLCSNPFPYPLKQTVFGSMSYTPPDFTFVGPSSINGPAGQTSTFTLALTSQTSFQDTVYLFDTGMPSGFTTSFSPSSIAIGGGSTAQVSYSITVPPNPPSPYFWTLTARTVGSTQLVHTWTVSSNPDFSISSNPSSIAMTCNATSCGAWGSTACPVPVVTVQSLGYAGTVSFLVSSAYSQLRQSSATSPILQETTITNGASISGNLYIWSTTGSSGTSTVTVSAYAGSFSGQGDPPTPNHSAIVSVTFGPNYVNGCGDFGGGGGGGHQM